MWWRTKFADENTIPKQIIHMDSELNEVRHEFYSAELYIQAGDLEEADKAVHRMKQEALDLIQSTYTLLHILGMTEREHEKMKWEMYLKNHNRGYYKKESPK